MIGIIFGLISFVIGLILYIVGSLTFWFGVGVSLYFLGIFLIFLGVVGGPILVIMELFGFIIPALIASFVMGGIITFLMPVLLIFIIIAYFFIRKTSESNKTYEILNSLEFGKSLFKNNSNLISLINSNQLYICIILLILILIITLIILFIKKRKANHKKLIKKHDENDN